LKDNEYDYRIEALSATFCKHAEEADRIRKEHIRNFKDKFPGEKIPDYSLDNFNICRALSVMACEIEKLKSMR